MWTAVAKVYHSVLRGINWLHRIWLYLYSNTQLGQHFLHEPNTGKSRCIPS